MEDDAYTIGKSFGTYIKNMGETKTIIGHDNRLSSPILTDALIKGITETGINVIYLGLVTTPMYYFARKKYNLETGIMVTASHNPKAYNGFKIAFSKIGNAYGELIQDFKKFTEKLQFASGEGTIEEVDIKKDYKRDYEYDDIATSFMGFLSEINPQFKENVLATSSFLEDNQK